MWTLSAGPGGPSGAPTRQLTVARSRRFTARLAGPSELQITIDGRHEEAAELEPLVSDIWAWRDGVKLFRGRMCPEQEDISPNVHTLVTTCVDYRGLLAAMGRSVGAAGRTFTSTDQSLMAWTLIAETQATTGGNLGITRGSGQTTGVNRVNTIKPFTGVVHEIDLIANLDNGFDWEISPDLEFNVYHPTRDNGHGVVLDYGGLLGSLRRQFDPTTFANRVDVTGAEGLTAAGQSAAGLSTDPRGRWELVESFPSITDQATLNARPAALLAQTTTLAAQWTATLAQGRWEGPGHIWVGDTVTLAVKSGRHDIADPYRVVELAVAIGESGEETVTLSLVAA